MMALRQRVILLVAVAIHASIATQKPVINVIGLFPTSENVSEGSIGRGVQPAVELAVHLVNRNTTLLTNYELSIHTSDTRCDMAVATKVYFDIMYRNATNAMLFGDACWEVTGPLAQISKWWNMTMAHENFERLTGHHDIEMKGHSFADDPKAAVQSLKDEDFRIIIGNFSPQMARQVFCAAYKLDLYGAKHQWIILGGYPKGWWRQADDLIDCTPDELEEAVHGYIATDIEPVTANPDVTESGLTPQAYLSMYNEKRKNAYSKYHGYAFDGVWVIAEAIDRLLKENHGVNRSLADLNALFRGHALSDQLNATDFQGVTGKVRFQNGDRLGEIMLEQNHYGNMVKIGVYRDPNYLQLFYHRLLWRSSDNKPPRDRNVRRDRILRVAVAIYSGLTVLACVGMLMALCFLTVNIYFRQHRYIKMSSPNMNNLIIFGCLLTYISVILLGSDGNIVTPENFHHMCAARSWVMAVGFTLAFGAMFGKTWRVHAIFTNIKLNKKVIKDYTLIMIVGVLLLIDAVILTLWQAIDPLRRDTRQLKSEIIGDIEEVQILEFCTSSHMTTWLVIVYVYKGILLMIGCFFAWETRHVSIPALNDSKYIGMSVYNVVILCLCGAAVSFMVNDQPNSAFTIVGLFIIFCSTITLCLVFVPKIIELKRDPKGDEKRVRATLSKTTKKSNEKVQDSLSYKIKVLLDENSNYRAVLDDKTREIRELLHILGEDASSYEHPYKGAANKTLLALRDNNWQLSPSRVSRLSNMTDDENASMFSETSMTHLYPMDSPENSRLKSYMKARSSVTDSGASDVFDLSDIGTRGTNRNRATPTRPSKQNESASRDKFDPFGGVYLGPADDDEEQPMNDSPRDDYPIIHELSSDNSNGHSDSDKNPRSNHANMASTFLPVLRETEEEYSVEQGTSGQGLSPRKDAADSEEIMIIGELFGGGGAKKDCTDQKAKLNAPSFVKHRKIQPKQPRPMPKDCVICDVVEYI